MLGEGGFSIVYAAQDLNLGREVAIKEYVPVLLATRGDDGSVRVRSERHDEGFHAGLEGFVNEARLLARFRDPALVEVLEFWEQNGTAYMVMPRYVGLTLRSALKQLDFECSEAWLKGLVAPILGALEVLHTQDVYHRDVAPDNILIKNDGRLVLLDLGSARQLVEETQDAVTVMVRSGYTPVEQYASSSALPQGPWTDVYALGAVLYFAVTRRAPPQSMTRVLRDSYEPLVEMPGLACSRSFLAAIDRALALLPKDRPQSIGELRDALGIRGSEQAAIPMEQLRRKLRDVEPADPAEDGERTEVVSVQEFSNLVTRIMSDADSEAGSAGRDPLAPVADPPSPGQDKSAQLFPEMEDLLAGRLSGEAESAAAPPTTKSPAQQSSPQPDAPRKVPHAAAPAPAARAWLPVAALLAVVTIVAVLWWVLPQDTPSSAATTPIPSAATMAPAAVQVVAVEEPAIDRQAPVMAPERKTSAAGILALDLPWLAQGATRVPLLPQADSGSTDEPAPWVAWNRADATTRQLDMRPPWAQPAAAPDASEPGASAPSSAAPVAAIAAQQDAQPRNAADRSTREVNRPSAAAEPVAAVETGTLVIRAKPWAEVWVDGQKVGVSPPLRELVIGVGIRRIELKSPGLATYARSVTVETGAKVAISHDFAVMPVASGTELKGKATTNEGANE